MNSFLQNCEGGICIREHLKGESGDPVKSISYNTNGEIRIIPEGAMTSSEYMQCFTFYDLMFALAAEPPINPKTRQRFSKMTEDMLLKNFSKEIKMAKYFIAIIEARRKKEQELTE